MYGNIARRMLNAMTFVTDDIRAYIAGYTVVVLLISLSSAFLSRARAVSISSSVRRFTTLL